jgi:urease accessory protein
VKARVVTPGGTSQPVKDALLSIGSGLDARGFDCPHQLRGERLEAPANTSAGLAVPNSPDPVLLQPVTDWLIWQIADSAFPTGGFAHSNGLEAAWQQGEIPSCEELVDFVEVHLAQTGRTALPFVNEAYHECRPFAQLDRLCDVFLSNHVANRCSRAQGQAFLMATAQAFGSASLVSFRAGVVKERHPGHLAPVFGKVSRMLEISHGLCLRLFLFMNLRTVLASAVRLGIVGPMAAQSLQWQLTRYAEQVALRCATTRVAEAAQTSPLLDILHGAHDRLYSRLFQT